MSDFQNQSWIRKFSNAFRGIWICAKSQRSFWIHIPAALLVVLISIAVQVSYAEGLVIALAISLVLALELMNTALEFLARAVTSEESPMVRDSLDAASGSVLVGAIGALVVGAWILIPKLFGLWAAN